MIKKMKKFPELECLTETVRRTVDYNFEGEKKYKIRNRW